MTLALLKEPVFLIDKRVKAAFMFAATDNDNHINLLKELAMLLDDDEFLDLILNKKDPDAIMRKIKASEYPK
jgi:mannitol/fructose-specific phosphotransferase system IIA component (Ntr-type)